jgi:geranylgeranyl diphosphate synthase type II
MRPATTFPHSVSAVDNLTAALLAYSPAAKTTEPHLAAALKDALDQPGRLVRAQLVLRGGLVHGLPENEALSLATAVEYFHLASLLFDDLPCMDNSTTRRGRPCLHQTHGNASTILTALALINRAYALAHDVLSQLPPLVQTAARECLETVLGAGGILEGQSRDLSYSASPHSEREVLRVAVKKTGALFLLSVYLPAILGKPSKSEQRSVRALCVYWGLMYQVLDDLNDVLSTSHDTGKSSGRDQMLNRPNLAIAIGVPAARRRLLRLLELADCTIQRLSLNSRLSYLSEFHHNYFSEPIRQNALLEARSAA